MGCVYEEGEKIPSSLDQVEEYLILYIYLYSKFVAVTFKVISIVIFIHKKFLKLCGRQSIFYFSLSLFHYFLDYFLLSKK